VNARYAIRASATVFAILTASVPAVGQTAGDPNQATPQTDINTANGATPPSTRKGTQQSAIAAPAGSDNGEEIVVTGLRASLQTAANIKRNAPQIVDSIVADDIGKFPDRTVAAALQRVPGVQVVVGDNNEIVNPIIRGLSDILTTLDGREIFTGTGRGFAYQDLPAEALAGADVYKSTSAELIEGGVAGIVNLKLHKPFDFKGFTIAANARGIYTDNTHKVNPSVGLLVANRWETGIGEIGALVDVSYARNDFNRPISFNCDFRSGNHGPAGGAGIIAPTCLGGLNQEGVYERPQANVALQWKPAPDIELYANGLYAGYRASWNTIFLIDDIFGGSSFSNVVQGSECKDYAVNGAGFYDPKGTTEHLCTATSLTSTGHGGFTSTQAHHDRTDLYIVSGGAKYDHGPLSLSTDVSYQNSRIRNQNFILDIFKSGNGINTDLLSINDGGGTHYLDTANSLSTPANFALSPLNQDNIKDKGDEFAIKGDGRYTLGGLLKNIQFGVRYANHKATHEQSLGGTCGVITAACGTLITNVAFLPSNFLRNTSGIPNVNNGVGVIAPNGDELRDPTLQDKLRAYYGLQPGFPPFTADRTFSAKERTYSGYIQTAYAVPISGPLVLDGLIGFRYTHTDRDVAGAAFVTPASTPGNPNPAPVLTPSSASTKDDDFLPNASARLKFGGGLQARFTYARAIARPAFGDLNPGLSYLISTNALILPSGNGGNPNLKPQQADSFDGTLEYYFQKNGFIAVGGYYKDITNRVISQSQIEQIGGVGYNIARPRNVGQVTLKGIEVSGETFFDFLPGALGGLGAFGNFTLADSKVETRSDVLFGQRLQGVSKYNFNVGGLYEKYGFNGRIVYTHRSGYYDENYGGVNVRPVGQTLILNGVRANGRLDASLGYDILPGVTLSIDGTNITRETYRSYYGDPNLPRDKRYDDTTYSVGVTARF